MVTHKLPTQAAHKAEKVEVVHLPQPRSQHGTMCASNSLNLTTSHHFGNILVNAPGSDQLKSSPSVTVSSETVLTKQPIQAKSNPDNPTHDISSGKVKNKTGIPAILKNNAEAISGLDMSDVKVNYDSPTPGIFGALAYTQANEIHLGSGQEKHLSHEVWHVVQQKQGRVLSANTKFNGTAINDDLGLEMEADQMGDKLSKVNLLSSSPLSVNSNKTSVIQQKIIQRKKIPMDFGDFETTKFEEADGRGVEIILKFNPDEAKVDAKKIALSQSIKNTTASSTAYGLDPNQASKMPGSGKAGEGYYIDTLQGTTNPLYGQDNNLGPTKSLKDTPETANKTGAATSVGVNTNYEFGHCYKVKPADAKKTKRAASLWDKPQGGKHKGESQTFETTALAIEGTDKDKYYGSVKWGYKMEGTDALPTVTISDIEEASKGTPTANFIEAAKLWNAGKTLGKLKVTADPEATVLKGDASGTEKLAKDKKLKLVNTVMWGTDPAVRAEILNDDGTGSGKIIYIKNADVVDVGDGAADKVLPIPAK